MVRMSSGRARPTVSRAKTATPARPRVKTATRAARPTSRANRSAGARVSRARKAPTKARGPRARNRVNRPSNRAQAASTRSRVRSRQNPRTRSSRPAVRTRAATRSQRPRNRRPSPERRARTKKTKSPVMEIGAKVHAEAAVAAEAQEPPELNPGIRLAPLDLSSRQDDPQAVPGTLQNSTAAQLGSGRESINQRPDSLGERAPNQKCLLGLQAEQMQNRSSPDFDLQRIKREPDVLPAQDAVQLNPLRKVALG
jgi:hypothetical protein